MDVTPRKRTKIVTLHEHTSSTYREIAKIVGVSLATVSRVIKLKHDTGSVTPKRKGKCGRKKKTTPRDDAYLIRQSKKDPRKTSDALNTDLKQKGIEISSSTVRRRLLAVGRRARRPVKKQLLTKAMKEKRYKWAKKYKDWTKEQWRKVIFSDGSHFFVQGQRSQHVRRSSGEKIRDSHIDQCVKHPLKKMFWGCFSYYGVGSLHPVEGMMRSAQYIDVLQKRLVPELEKRFPDGSGIFQQDLAPCHTSKIVKNFMTEKNIQVLDWPGNSPDVSPIENLWAICKSRLRTMDCTTKEMLIQALIQGRQNAVGLVAVPSQRLTSSLTAPLSCTFITSHAWHNSHPTPAPSPTHHNAAGIRTADAGKEMLEITFADGNSSFFPYCWLRDNCQCPQCFDSDALCRKLTLEDWQHNDCPRSVQVEEGGRHVEVQWVSGHKSCYEAQWLQQHAFTPSARDSQRSFLAIKKELWSTEMELPRMDYNGVMHGDKELLDFLVTLEKKGVVVLTDAPREPEAVLTIINSIGYVKPTHYGTNYPIRSKASASSLAYTDQRLGMHNDLPYFQYVPGIIFLHCITQFEGKGGENDLADGFHVADYLKQFHPTEYRILTDTPVYFWDKGVAQVKQETTEYHKIVNIPIIVEDRLSGDVVRVNNSQLRNSYLDLPPEQVTPWYAALRLFNQTVDQQSIRNKLNSGEMLVMDNTRLMHGRTGYDSALGERHMNQAYLDWDGALSRRRVLQEKLGVTLE